MGNNNILGTRGANYNSSNSPSPNHNKVIPPSTKTNVLIAAGKAYRSIALSRGIGKFSAPSEALRSAQFQRAASLPIEWARRRQQKEAFPKQTDLSNGSISPRGDLNDSEGPNGKTAAQLTPRSIQIARVGVGMRHGPSPSPRPVHETRSSPNSARGSPFITQPVAPGLFTGNSNSNFALNPRKLNVNKSAKHPGVAQTGTNDESFTQNVESDNTDAGPPLKVNESGSSHETNPAGDSHDDSDNHLLAKYESDLNRHRIDSKSQSPGRNNKDPNNFTLNWLKVNRVPKAAITKVPAPGPSSSSKYSQQNTNFGKGFSPNLKVLKDPETVLLPTTPGVLDISKVPAIGRGVGFPGVKIQVQKKPKNVDRFFDRRAMSLTPPDSKNIVVTVGSEDPESPLELSDEGGSKSIESVKDSDGNAAKSGISKSPSVTESPKNPDIGKTRSELQNRFDSNHIAGKTLSGLGLSVKNFNKATKSQSTSTWASESKDRGIIPCVGKPIFSPRS